MSGDEPDGVARSGEAETGADKRLLWFENSGQGLVVDSGKGEVWAKVHRFVDRHR